MQLRGCAGGGLGDLCAIGLSFDRAELRFVGTDERFTRLNRADHHDVLACRRADKLSSRAVARLFIAKLGNDAESTLRAVLHRRVHVGLADANLGVTAARKCRSEAAGDANCGARSAIRGRTRSRAKLTPGIAGVVVAVSRRGAVATVADTADTCTAPTAEHRHGDHDDSSHNPLVHGRGLPRRGGVVNSDKEGEGALMQTGAA